MPDHVAHLPALLKRMSRRSSLRRRSFAARATSWTLLRSQGTNSVLDSTSLLFNPFLFTHSAMDSWNFDSLLARMYTLATP
jgi:hypothetical protein